MAREGKRKVSDLQDFGEDEESLSIEELNARMEDFTRRLNQQRERYAEEMIIGWCQVNIIIIF